MSATLMGLVWTIELQAPEQAVLMALADHAKDDPGRPGYGFDIYPSVYLLAWKTGKTERQIQRILRKLESMRLIIPTAYAKGGRNHSVCYEMFISNGIAKLPPKNQKGDIQGQCDETGKGDIQGLTQNQGLKGDIQGLKGDIQGLKGDIAMSPEPLRTIKNHQENHHARTRVTLDEKNENEPEAEQTERRPMAFPAFKIAYCEQEGYTPGQVKTSKLMAAYTRYRASFDADVTTREEANSND